ncbi:MAG: glycosyltransferase [Erythrobacter sp.]
MQAKADEGGQRVALVIPALNEEAALPALAANLAALSPPPDEIILVDGGSIDRTVAIAREASWRAVIGPRGRGAQINRGVREATSAIICVVHADTHLPHDAVAVIRAAMANPRLALASFMPRFVGPQGTRWGSTFNNWAKTWYVPLLLRPRLFLRGVRLLFGDHAMIFRRAQFLATGGCDETVAVLEEVELCVRLSRFGRTRILPRFVRTSDRRIRHLGRWRANWAYLKVGYLWLRGERAGLASHYPDIR